VKKLQRNYLLPTRIWKCLLVLVFLFSQIVNAQQVVNYVYNPSFELTLSTATLNPYDAVKYWGPIDTNNNATRLFSMPLGSSPYGFGGFQYPKTGKSFIGTQFYCNPNTCFDSQRWYPRNRLKQLLKPNTAYCAKYYIVNTNNCSVGIDSYGIYFGSVTLDTIKYCSIPLTYIIPQIENQNGIITDTLYWTPITGTFVASGSEKYLVLGNFNSNANTNTLLINPSFLPSQVTDVLIDDVSLIELNLPAFAGRDTSVIPGDSIFIGREPDIGIDEACMWYKMPTIITPTTPALDTVAGFWIKPVTSCTYIVRQQLWCSGVKWDTVVIHMNPVGIEKLKILTEELKLFPVPAKDELQLSIHNTELIKEFHSLSIYNNLGLLIREDETKFQNGSFKINTTDLPSGVYSLQLKSNSNETVSKRFVISR
jgi:hypothetical protein